MKEKKRCCPDSDICAMRKKCLEGNKVELPKDTDIPQEPVLSELEEKEIPF